MPPPFKFSPELVVVDEFLTPPIPLPLGRLPQLSASCAGTLALTLGLGFETRGHRRCLSSPTPVASVVRL
uniref:Uncharacterized protein n=1 Tax=Arundo donax TaxID=35708 RepID=A0A0A9F5K8_ARUDO